MAYFFKKKVRGLVYWYLGENKKVNGISKRVWQKYLGTADSVNKRLSTISTPVEIDVLEFGVCSTLLNVSNMVNFTTIVDEVFNKREQGLSYGEHLLLTIINRIDNPRSKNKLGDWFDSTILKRLFSVKKSYLSSQSFWNHWTKISDEQIDTIQELLLQQLVKQCEISELCFDPTNFTTYIQDHKKQELMQFGHAKDGRKGFRQVNLSLLVSKKEGIPLWHHTYGGNVNDVTEFKELIKSLTNKISYFSKKCKKITLVFDKGNNSKNNMKKITKKLSFFIVGSLKPSEYLKLFDIPLDEFNDEYLTAQQKKVFCTSKILDVYDGKKKVVVTYSNELAYKNKLRVEKSLTKALDRLQNLKGRLKNSKMTRDELLLKVYDIVGKQYIRSLITYQVEHKPNGLSLTYERDQKAYEQKSKQFGKNILFTDDLTLKPTEIVKIYHDKNIVEEQVKNLKDTHVISFTPMWCWTDKMIRVHAFTCVMALLFLRLMVKEVRKRKIDLSQIEMLEQLKNIKQTLLKMPNTDKIQTKITRLNQNQRQLVKLFDLKKYV